ncbi:unnamed protein product [Bursaphelenchus xylophilus]|uniref:(pine wood nematode) hypothetical protein n=1 Tax=Bursaphelenchus xylophilus TaxID=6326 RepID=A0A1I7SL20_BURXY|nr:unnamed protein product [Bursaphelenchus xylophilus]CAG9129338.1 unnamed protein product [Bursaphelenchus xylophilus]
MDRASPDLGSDEGDERSIGTSSGNLVCLVCGDTATGRHYGSVACNGCKGFFRRTIRRNYKYSCRFSGNCQIDKHNRAVCRACRYARCIRYGMKVDAVQNERDLIGKRPRTQSANGPGTISPPNGSNPVASPTSVGVANFFNSDSTGSGTVPTTSTDPWESPKALLELLLRSEEKEKNLRATVIKETGKLEFTTKNEPRFSTNANRRKATYNDILHSLHSQLLLVIEWAKTLRPFAELSTEDQTALLKNFASQHIVLCVAYRSINACDMLQLINDTCIPRASGRTDDFYSKDCDRVMDTLVAPMRFLQMDDVEFVTMKACVLFDPVARGLSNESVMKVLDTRRRIFSALEFYAKSRHGENSSRVGDLTFFILSPLQSLARSISEDILVSKLSGMARIDMLMEELILEDTEPKQRTPLNLQRSLSETEDPSFVDFPAPMSATSEPQLSNPPSYEDPLVFQPVGSAPAQGDLQVPTDKHNAIPAMKSEMSPIHQYEMMSTLSSYVFGGTLQSPLSPSNDVMFSSAASVNPSNDLIESKVNPQAMEETVMMSSPPSQQWPQNPPMSSGRLSAHLNYNNTPNVASPGNMFMPQASLNF